MSKSKPAELLTDIMLMVFRLNGRVLEAGDHLVAPLGLTSARWQLLGAVAMAGKPLSAPQIADAMGISRQGAQKQLHRLVDEGLFEPQANPRHERSPLYSLSERGHSLYQQAITLHGGWSKALSKHLDADELQQALQTLQKIEQTLIEDSEESR